jgi:hypothetical protein
MMVMVAIGHAHAHAITHAHSVAETHAHAVAHSVAEAHAGAIEANAVQTGTTEARTVEAGTIEASIIEAGAVQTTVPLGLVAHRCLVIHLLVHCLIVGGVIATARTVLVAAMALVACVFESRLARMAAAAVAG